jgi:hypothetical protein
LSEDYVAKIKSRLNETREGEPLDGAADPLTSAPPTPHTPKTCRHRILPKTDRQRALLDE